MAIRRKYKEPMNEIIINVDKEKKMIEKNLHVNTLIICVKKTNI